jgi:CRP-like cAMP-binding protein/ATP/ADP translocase
MAQILRYLFKLEKNEIKPVGMIFLITFLWGTSQMFSYTAANVIFLKVYGASFLSFTFIFNAVLIPLTGIAVMKASEIFSFRKYFSGTLIFFVLSLSFSFIMLSFTKLKWPAMTYLLWLDIEFTVSNVLFMALLNKLFNIRQSKRVFGPAGLGTDLSYIIIGFAISILVNHTGVLNLTLFAIAFNFVSIFVFFWIYLSFPEKIGRTDIVIREGAEQYEKVTVKDLFKKKFVLLIVALGSIFTVSFCFGTNLYMEQTQTYLTDENKIASFIALFYSISSFILLFVKGFVASRLMKNFGMTVCLLLTPLLIGASALAFIVFLKFTISPFIVFMLVVGIYMTQTVFGSSIHKSSYFSLIQSLPGNETNKVINLSETIVPNLLNGIAGAILLVMMRIFKTGSLELGIGIMIITAIWLAIAFLLGKEYKKNLSNILKNKFDPDTVLSLSDPEILRSVMSGLKSAYPQEVVNSMQMLENAGIRGLKSKVKELTYSEDPSIRRKVFEIYEKDGQPDDLIFLKARLPEEKDAGNISALLNAIANSSKGTETGLIEEYLHHENKIISMGAFTALIRYCGIKGIRKVKNELHQVAESPHSINREFAAELIGNVSRPNFYKLLIPLLSDNNMNVKKKAFEATGNIRNPKLVPFMIKNLNDGALRPIVMRNLIRFSNIAFPELEKIYRTDPACRKLIAYIYGRIKGEESVRMLFRKLKESDLDVLAEILNSLELCNFKIDRENKAEFENNLDDMIGFGINLSLALKDLNNPGIAGIISDALKNEIRKNKSRVFSLIYILHPDRNIRDIRFNYFFGQTEEKKALAIELLDNILSKKYKSHILHLMEDSGSVPESTAIGHQHRKMGCRERLEEIIREKETWKNVWLRSLVYFSMIKEGNGKIGEKIEEMLKDENPQVAEFLQPKERENGSIFSLIDIVLLIRKCGIFSGIEDESLVEIAKCMDVKSYLQDSRIFSKNDEGAQLYVISEGAVKIHDGERMIAELKSGEVFGEMSVFSPEKRSADSTALTDTTLFSISQSDIFRIIDDRIEIAIDIIGILCTRLRHTLAEGIYKPAGISGDHPSDKVEMRPVSEKQHLTNIEKMMALKTVNIFSNIQDNILYDLADMSRELFVTSGKILFEKDDTGTSMFIVVTGAMKVHDGEKTIAILKEREIIGELAALSSETRTATVTALKDTLLLNLTRESIYEIMWDQRMAAKEFIKVLAERLRNLI